MRWFAYLAAPLLFVTIILPIVAGPIFRQLLQWYIRFRNFWRFGFVISWIFYTITIYILASRASIDYSANLVGFSMLLAYDTSILVMALARVYFAFMAAQSQRGSIYHVVLNLLFAVGAAGTIMLDFLIHVRVIMGTFAWIAMPLIMYYEYRHDARDIQTPTSKKEQPH